MEPKDGDLLNIDKFNALPGPVTARMIGGGEHWIETLCPLSGLMRLDVCGQIDVFVYFSMVDTLIDADCNEHDPDLFYIDSKEEK
jgi:hypothetical protein